MSYTLLTIWHWCTACYWRCITTSGSWGWRRTHLSFHWFLFAFRSRI